MSVFGGGVRGEGGGVCVCMCVCVRRGGGARGGRSCMRGYACTHACVGACAAARVRMRMCFVWEVVFVKKKSNYLKYKYEGKILDCRNLCP